MKKIKVLFFLPNLGGGGAERVTLNIIKLLDKNLYEVHLAIANTSGNTYEVPKDVSFYNLNVSKTIFSIRKLSRLIKKLNPEIVFSSLIRGHIAVYFALLRLKKKPFIIFRSPNSPKLLSENKQMFLVQKIILDIAYRNANLIIAQTPEMKKELHVYNYLDLNKIEVLINPLDTQLIDEKIQNIENPFNNSNINIVASGRITYQKGFDVLIKSFKNVVKKNHKFNLYILGTGQNIEIEKLTEIIDSLELSENVHFLGYQENPYKYYYYSDLYILSSRWEGLPNTVLENLYLHKPVVSTRCIPFMETLINEGRNGFLVDVENIHQLTDAILSYQQLSLVFADKYTDQKELINTLFKRRQF